ncbi:MAG: hypothetical protein AAFP18_00785 [Bacteroidota bacterium]
MLRLLVGVLLCGLLVTAPACDSVEAQRDFSAQAFLPPNGLDNDDWQIAPFFATAAFFLETPSPNPVPSGEVVAFTLRVQEPSAFPGAIILTTSFDFDGDGDDREPDETIFLDTVEYDGGAQFFVDFDPRRSVGGVTRTFPPGATYRLRILAGGEVLTYGDIRLGN